MSEVLRAGLHLRGGHVVQSIRHPRVYYLGAVVEGVEIGRSEVERSEVDGSLGIWLVGGTKDEPAMVVSVNAWANEMSEAPWGPGTAAEVSLADPEVWALRQHYAD